MKFCPKCGAILLPKKQGGKQAYVCSCGHTEPIGEDDSLKQTNEASKDIEIIDEEKDVDANPLVEAECPKCGHNKANFWLEQTRSSDEPETKFFKCEKCKHRWRDYS